MIRNDTSYWPVVVSVAKGLSPAWEQAAFLEDWTGWLDRDEPFVTIRRFVDQEALVRPQGSAKIAKEWLGRNRQRLPSRVLGMATIVPLASLEEVARMDAEKLFGVPARAFADVDEALEWSAARLPAAERPALEAARRLLIAS